MRDHILPHETARVALPGVPTSGLTRPTREPTPELRPGLVRGVGGRAGVYDQMERGHPRIAAGVDDLILATSGAHIEWTCGDDSTASERAFTETLRMLLDGVYVDAEQRLAGWGALAPSLTMYWRRGFGLWEARWVEDDTARYPVSVLDGLALELYPIHPSTVDRWEQVSLTSSRLRRVYQTTSGGFRAIPADCLIHVQRDGAAGEYEGVAILRPLVFPFERWKTVVLSDERLWYLLAGTAVVSETQLANDEDRSRLLQTMQAWANGYAPWLVKPRGYEVDMSYPSGTAPDVRSRLEYWDAQIDDLLNRQIASLGYSQHGSRALGEEASTAASWRDARRLDQMLGQFGRRVASWVAPQVGYVGRLPSLHSVGEESVDVGARVSVLGQAVSAGLVSWGSEDEATLRESMDLGERASVEDTRTLLVGQIQAAQSIVAQLAPADPLTPPLAPEAARILLVAAGVSEDSADAIVTAQRGITGAPVAEATQHEHTCTHAGCCDDVTMGAPVEVVDASGETYTASRELDGAVEQSVAWSEIDRTMARLGREVTASIAQVADDHRDALRRALWSGDELTWSPATQAGIYDQAVAEYRRAIDRYISSMRDAVRQWAEDEARRQAASGAPRGGAPVTGDVASQLRRALAGIDAQADVAAEIIANRVQGEIESYATGGGMPSQWQTSITDDGLARHALAVGQRIESAGRIEAAEEVAQQTGLRIVSVRRQSIRDQRRCGHCASRDGVVYAIPEQVEEYRSEPLPDPECAGGAQRCRCGWLIEWGTT